MNTYTRRFLPIILLSIFLLVGTSIPAWSGFWMGYELEYIECIAEGNEAHVHSTLLGPYSQVYNAVGPADQFDWYIIPLSGDVLWGGNITCISNGPGLAVRLYIDTGTGLTVLKEQSPVLNTGWGEAIYVLSWNLLDIAAAAGHAAGPAGSYYIRITYYSAYPVDHPYMLSLSVRPEAFNPSPFNSSATARVLPPGITHYGHLSPGDPNDFFSFQIPPGQTGTGIIFCDKLFSVILLAKTDGNSGDGINQKKVMKIASHTDIKLYDSSVALIASAAVNPGAPAYIDPSSSLALAPGTYYIEVSHTGAFPAMNEIYYKLFNHILAPNTDDWGADANTGKASATPLVEGTPVNGSVYWPRDDADYFSFNSPYYFLGDIDIEPVYNPFTMETHFIGPGDSWYWGDWLPGKGITCKFYPLPAGNYYLVLNDRYNEVTPLNYTLTFYQHGSPMTGSMGHTTWETAYNILPLITPEGYTGENADISIDFQPGVQDVFFGKLTVPAAQFLVGYYDIYGSRPDYRLRLGQLGPEGTPIWAPALSPNAKGKLTLDLNYKYLSSAGTYLLKVEMLPSSPGRMRVLIDNNSRITECAADTNNTYDQGPNLKGITREGVYVQDGEFCPPLDNIDWYYFNSGLFDETKGPKQNISLRGGADGMKVELYDSGFTFLKGAEVTEVGGWATLDIDGVVVPDAMYYVNVSADTTEQRVQIYELSLRNDLIFAFPFRKLMKAKKPIIDPGVYEWLQHSIGTGVLY